MIFNINVIDDELISDLDESRWVQVDEKQINILYCYHMDKPAETGVELVAEYPSGGKEYKEIIISPEQGHFDVTYKDGSVFPYHIDIPKDISKDIPVPDIITMIYWKQLTEEEIAQKEQELLESQNKAEAQEKFLEDGPSQLNDIQTTQDDMILLLADIVGGAV